MQAFVVKDRRLILSLLIPHCWQKSIVTDADGFYMCLFICIISQKSMQLRSLNLTQKCSTMSPGDAFILRSKGQRSRSRVTKTLPTSVFALLWVLASSNVLPSFYVCCAAEWRWSAYYCIIGWSNGHGGQTDSACSRQRQVFRRRLADVLTPPCRLSCCRHRLCDVTRDKIIMIRTTARTWQLNPHFHMHASVIILNQKMPLLATFGVLN